MAGLQTPPWGPEFNAIALRFWQPSDSTASWAGAGLTSEARVRSPVYRRKGRPLRPVAAVERLGIDAIQVPHQPGQVRRTGVKHQMKVFAHLAIVWQLASTCASNRSIARAKMSSWASRSASSR